MKMQTIIRHLKQHLGFTFATVLPIFALTPALIGLNNLKQPTNQSNPEDLFDLEWKPTAALTIKPISGDFQSAVDNMFQTQQLQLNWKLGVVAPAQLLQQYQNDYDNLTNAISLNYYDQVNKQWSDDHNWDFKIINVNQLDNKIFNFTVEIYEQDGNFLATGRVATIQQTLSLTNQESNTNSYYQTFLSQVKLQRAHQYSNLSFSALFKATNSQTNFQKWWRIPSVIGANLEIFYPNQVVRTSFDYQLKLTNSQGLYITSLIQQYQVSPSPLLVGLINRADFKQAHQLLTTWGGNLNALTIINDHTTTAIKIDQDWSNFKINRFDISGFEQIEFAKAFRPFTSLGDDQLVSIKLPQRFSQLIVPNQNPGWSATSVINFPQSASLVKLTQWATFFNFNIDNEILVNNYLDPIVISQAFKNYQNIYDVATQTLNLELIRLWNENFKLNNDKLKYAILSNYLKSQIKGVKTLIMPLGGIDPTWYGDDLPWYSNLYDSTQVNTLKFASTWYNEHLKPEQQIYEQFAADRIIGKAFPLVSELSIPSSVVVFKYQSFAHQIEAILAKRLDHIKISRQIDDKILQLVKDKSRLDLSQVLPVKIANSISKNNSLAFYGANNIFNTFDVVTNQSLYQHISDLIVDFDQLPPFSIDAGTQLLSNDIVNSQFGFLFNQADWDLENHQLRPQSGGTIKRWWTSIQNPIKSHQKRNLSIKTAQPRYFEKMYHEWTNQTSDKIDSGFFLAKANFIVKSLELTTKPLAQPSFIKNGVLKLRDYLDQFAQNQTDSYLALMNYQDQVKTIDVTNVDQINHYAFSGIYFKNDVTIDLKNVKTIGDFAFNNTNLKYKNLDFNQLNRLGKFSFSANFNGLNLVDFTKSTESIIPAGAFLLTPIKTLKIGPNIKTIEKFAFYQSQLYAPVDQPLDLQNVQTIELGAFSYNDQLEQVKISDQYQIFQGFEHSGLKTFNFQPIKFLTYPFQTNSSYDDNFMSSLDLDNKTLQLANFKDIVIDLTNVIAFQGSFNLPTVNKIVLNPNFAYDGFVRGFTNLKTIVNFNQTIDPIAFFGKTKFINYEFENLQTTTVSASQIGYNERTGVLDWSFWNNLIQNQQWSDINSNFNKIVNKTIQYFSTNRIEQIKQLVLPNAIYFVFNNNNNNRILDRIQLPPINELALEKHPNNAYMTNSLDASAISRFLSHQKIDHLAPDFFKQWSDIPENAFNGVTFTNSNQIIDISHILAIGDNAFWNSNLNTFVGWEKDVIAGAQTSKELGKYVFNRDVNIKIGRNYIWNKLSFGYLPFEKMANSIAIADYNETFDPSLDGYYDPELKVLDFRQLAQFNDEQTFIKWLDQIKLALQTTTINVLVLPEWQAISSAWLNGWNFVNKLVISPKTTTFGITTTNNPTPAIRSQFKTIPKLIHTNIVYDGSGFWDLT